MSFCFSPGNDTIHRYPLPYEGKLKKLLCIGKESFEKLTLSTRQFFSLKSALKDTARETRIIQAPPKVPVPYLADNRKAVYSAYTPTKIWASRYSEFWQWQRVSEWHREYGQDEITNEKRHILV